MTADGITRRQFIKGAAAATVSFPFISLIGASASSDRPNFVFILTDDQRWDAMSCAGNTFVYTPHMDRIAKEGARFRNAFVTIALCSPSRACFLTGQYAHRHGIMDNRTPLPDTAQTFPRILNENGYDTAYIGKWHMGTQEGSRPGINHWVSFKGQGNYMNPKLNVNGKQTETAGYVTDILTKHAIDWLRKPRNAPFCLYLSHKAVHDFWKPAVRHSRLFSDTPLPRTPNFDDPLVDKPEWEVRNQNKAMYSKKAAEDFDLMTRDYYRTLMAVDDSVGSVMQTLVDQDVLDNTVVVFAGDNGFLLGEHGQMDKRSIYEESIRIPLLMRYPKLVRPNTLIDRMVLNIDICPTFLDLAGIPVPSDVQGISFRPLLQGNVSHWRDDWLYEYWQEGLFVPPTMRGVRTERYSYVEYPDTKDKSELFDLVNDPGQIRNLAEDPAYTKVLADMKARLARLVKETQ